MLALRIELLNGVYHAADPTAHRAPEWPPHPDRLFQALVAAAYGAGIDPAPLRRLEGPAPELAFGHWLAVQGATVYVPAAYKAAQSRVGKFDPMIVDIRDPVYVVWPELPDSLREALTPIAEAVTYLGRAKTPVDISVVLDVPDMPYRMVPCATGDQLLRVPHEGRLDELDAAFDAGRRAPVAMMTGYREGSETRPGSSWGELLTLRPKGPLDCRRAAGLADALRAAVLSRAGDDASPLLHGHAGEHAAWAVLPDVGHRHARGHVLGLGLWLPRGIDDAARTACVVPLMQVDHIKLGERRIGLHPQPAHRPMPRGLWRGTWARPARRWATVTPMVLDRHPKRGGCIEDCVADSVEMAGYPRPIEVQVDQVSTLKGVPLAREIRPRGRGHWTHVALAFEQRIAGPLLIGRERHFGMGLLRPVED